MCEELHPMLRWRCKKLIKLMIDGVEKNLEELQKLEREIFILDTTIGQYAWESK